MFGLWCNGSTTGFGSVCPSSNLGSPTFFKTFTVGIPLKQNFSGVFYCPPSILSINGLLRNCNLCLLSRIKCILTNKSDRIPIIELPFIFLRTPVSFLGFPSLKHTFRTSETYVSRSRNIRFPKGKPKKLFDAGKKPPQRFTFTIPPLHLLHPASWILHANVTSWQSFCNIENRPLGRLLKRRLKWKLMEANM